MEFDYFYVPEDAEQYQVYRIPKMLITGEQFKDVSVESWSPPTCRESIFLQVNEPKHIR